MRLLSHKVSVQLHVQFITPTFSSLSHTFHPILLVDVFGQFRVAAGGRREPRQGGAYKVKAEATVCPAHTDPAASSGAGMFGAV